MRVNIQISGTVQGVGFRPFVYNLACRLGLVGWVKNSRAGVEIEVEGREVDTFIESLSSSPPPLATIEHLTVRKIPPHAEPDSGFTIEPSSTGPVPSAARISPDITICNDCTKELFDRKDRRYLYPFINCTNCGPRYSIIKGLPYDRARTTMAPFTMCRVCRDEFADPRNRRFHAQPNGCKKCGPTARVYKKDSGTLKERGGATNYEAVKETQHALKDGKIVAIKGLGGFHIACDGANAEAVKRLRAFKRALIKSADSGTNKPFALMAASTEAAKAFATIDKGEERILSSTYSPIVLLNKRAGTDLSEEVAPASTTYGVMLPYTPLHMLLFHEAGSGFKALVMTSANLSDEPIVTDNNEAIERLGTVADLFLLHDREIAHRVDDSIVRIDNKRAKVLRRSRGLTPFALELKSKIPDAIAFGPQQKNTFCIGTERSLILSPHIGDLNTERAIEFQTEIINCLLYLNNVKPEIVAHDSHPGYTSTRRALAYAVAHSIPSNRVFAVQHHHAHIVSCMAEHGLAAPVIGVAFDGTGAGDDGNVWGGEFLIADRVEYKRAAHFKYIAMPGAESAIKEPWRMGLAYINETYKEQAGGVIERILKRVHKREKHVILKMIEQRINSPLTSSVGRLFDGLSAIAGLRDFATYEGEAAVELEAIATGAGNRVEELAELKPYCYEVTESTPSVIDVSATIRAVVEDIDKGVKQPEISLRFHVTIAAIITDVCKRLSQETAITDIVLSGGVFQNRLLCLLTEERLVGAGLTPCFNSVVPANDGGVSLGQIIVATERFAKQIKESGN